MSSKNDKLNIDNLSKQREQLGIPYYQGKEQESVNEGEQSYLICFVRF